MIALSVLATLLLTLNFVAFLPSSAAEQSPAPAALEARSHALLGSFPIEVVHSYPAAYLHWLDSLAGLNPENSTAGLSAGLYRKEYHERFGGLSELDRTRLHQFRDVREQFAQDRIPSKKQGLTRVLLQSESLDAFDPWLDKLLPRAQAQDMRQALAHFRPRFDQLWNDGNESKAFVSASSSRLGEQVGDFVARLADFFEVDLHEEPRARLYLVRAAPGETTHAQAIHNHLLVEFHPGESLHDQLATITHELTHFLFYRMSDEKFLAFETEIKALGNRGVYAWRTLLEALPTAIGQGVAAQRLASESWSAEAPWYVDVSVDRYAKTIFGQVQRALHGTQHLDPKLFRTLLEAYPNDGSDNESREKMDPRTRRRTGHWFAR